MVLFSWRPMVGAPQSRDHNPWLGWLHHDFAYHAFVLHHWWCLGEPYFPFSGWWLEISMIIRIWGSHSLQEGNLSGDQSVLPTISLPHPAKLCKDSGQPGGVNGGFNRLDINQDHMTGLRPYQQAGMTTSCNHYMETMEHEYSYTIAAIAI